jgi:LmbE family N-acetylglucosaminyl deacetylase
VTDQKRVARTTDPGTVSPRGGAPRLLAVVAHPDDESFGCGSLLAHASRNGFDVTVCCATRGESGDPTPGSITAGLDIAEVREAELYHAADILGVSTVHLLDFVDSGMSGEAPDGSLCAAPPAAVTDAVAEVLASIRPHVVVTLDASDGHRDHAAIRDATLGAVRRGSVETLATYLWCLPRELMQRWADLLAERDPDSDYLAFGALGTPADEITTVIDTAADLPVREAAMAAHRSQVSPYAALPDDLRAAFLCTDRLKLVEPAWPGGEIETSLLGRLS